MATGGTQCGLVEKSVSMTLQIAPCYLASIQDGVREQLQHLLMACATALRVCRAPGGSTAKWADSKLLRPLQVQP